MSVIARAGAEHVARDRPAGTGAPARRAADDGRAIGGASAPGGSIGGGLRHGVIERHRIERLAHASRRRNPGMRRGRRWAPPAAPAPRSDSASSSPTTTAFASSDDPPYEMNGSVMPVSGISLRLPAAMMNAWTPMTSARPAASSARKSSRAAGGDPQPPLDDDEVQAEDREQADEAQLLAQRRERVVGVDRGIGRRPPIVGRPLPSPTPRSPPRANAYSAWIDLEPGALRVRERVEPVVDALLDVAEQVVQDDRADEEQGQPAEHVATPGRSPRTAARGTRRRTAARRRGRAGRRRSTARSRPSRPSARGTGPAAA